MTEMADTRATDADTLYIRRREDATPPPARCLCLPPLRMPGYAKSAMQRKRRLRHEFTPSPMRAMLPCRHMPRSAISYMTYDDYLPLPHAPMPRPRAAAMFIVCGHYTLADAAAT